MDSRRQRAQAMFENKIGRAALESLNRHFLAQRACDEDEGHVRRLFLSQRQSREAVESRKTVVGENDRRVKTIEFVAELIFGIDSLESKIEAPVFEHMFDEDSVMHDILDHQNA